MTGSKLAMVIGLAVAVLGWFGPARATTCFMDAKGDGTGLPLKWPSMPIKYLINASAVATSDKTAFMDAVRAAFSSWERVSCTNIKFTDGGESSSTDPQGLGAILVYFAPGSTSSAYLSAPYYYTYNPPDIREGLIQLNLNITFGGTTYGFSVGPQTDKFDIQTGVKNLIPLMLGFCVEMSNGSCVIPSADWKTNYQNLAISNEEVDGARFDYFQAGPGCTQPTNLPSCIPATPTGDGAKRDGGGKITDAPKPLADGATPTGDVVKHDSGGKIADGSKPLADSTTPTGDVVKRDGGGITADGSIPMVDSARAGDKGSSGDQVTLPPSSNNTGCCRVGHTSNEGGIGLLALAGMALLLLALQRRRC